MSDRYPMMHLTTRAQLRDWLAHNHDRSDGVWLVSWRRDELGPRLAYEDVVLEALCWGWIDSTLRTLDDDRNALRLTPRKRGSVWSRSNKERVRLLEAEGLIQPPGTAAIARAREDGSWTMLDEVEDLVVPADLNAALAAAGARDAFDRLTPGRRKQSLYWVASAKREATRADRIAKVVAAAAEGRSAVD